MKWRSVSLRPKAVATLTVPAVTAAILACTAVSEATIIFQDDFESASAGGSVLDYKNWQKWSVLEGSVDAIQSGFNGIFCLESRGCVDLDGTDRDTGAGMFETKTGVFLLPGQEYVVSFALSGNQRGASAQDTVRVSLRDPFLGSLYEETFTKAIADPFERIYRTVTVDTLSFAFLRFDHRVMDPPKNTDFKGLILDDVRICTGGDPFCAEPGDPGPDGGPSPVPEPASLWLLMAGAGALLWHRRVR